MNLSKNPWSWVPSLYFAEGIPYVAVMTIALVLYKQLGLSNTEITYYTSWLYLPWVIKPLWSPFIDLIKTKRWWITSMQILIGAAFGGVAFTIPTDFWLQGTLAFFWLMAFSSATHDIAADGYYMLALDSHEQSWFVGIRSTFYRLAMIVGQGVLVMIAGTLEIIFRNQIAYSWSLLFYGCCGLFIAIWIWHTYVLPHPSEDGVREGVSASTILADFKETIKTFFQKEQFSIFSPDGRENPYLTIMCAVLGTAAELERETIYYRLKSGREKYIRDGGKLGKPKGSGVKTKEQMAVEYKAVIKNLKAGQSIRNTSKITGVSPATVQKVKHAFAL